VAIRITVWIQELISRFLLIEIYGNWLTDSPPDGGTGKTCLGGGLHCPSASSFIRVTTALMPVS